MIWVLAGCISIICVNDGNLGGAIVTLGVAAILKGFFGDD